MIARRSFITLLGGAAAAWPVVARGQQPDRMRRIGILVGGPDDAIILSRLSQFQQSLRQLGWIEGRNIEFNIRWGSNDAARLQTEARELIRSTPDVILAGPSSALVSLREHAKSIPIVFVLVSDPVGQGIIKSLARHGAVHRLQVRLG